MPEADYRRFRGPDPLPDTLWDGPGLARDRAGFGVLSVARYRGPRLSPGLSAHPCWEVVAVLGGTGELTGPQGRALRRGDALLIPPGAAHGEFAPLMLDTVWIALGGSRLRADPDRIAVVADESLCRLAEELWMQAAVRTGCSGGELDGLGLALTGRLLRLAAAGGGGDLIDAAVRWLHQHLDQPVAVADLAAHLRVSVPHLHRLFKARTRATPMAFLGRLRLERASHLLRHTDLPVARVAALAGYADALYFSRAFTRATGQPPSRWRSCAG